VMPPSAPEAPREIERVASSYDDFDTVTVQARSLDSAKSLSVAVEVSVVVRVMVVPSFASAVAVTVAPVSAVTTESSDSRIDAVTGRSRFCNTIDTDVEVDTSISRGPVPASVPSAASGPYARWVEPESVTVSVHVPTVTSLNVATPETSVVAVFVVPPLSSSRSMPLSVEPSVDVTVAVTDVDGSPTRFMEVAVTGSLATEEVVVTVVYPVFEAEKVTSRAVERAGTRISQAPEAVVSVTAGDEPTTVTDPPVKFPSSVPLTLSLVTVPETATNSATVPAAKELVPTVTVNLTPSACAKSRCGGSRLSPPEVDSVQVPGDTPEKV